MIYLSSNLRTSAESLKLRSQRKLTSSSSKQRSRIRVWPIGSMTSPGTFSIWNNRKKYCRNNSANTRTEISKCLIKWILSGTIKESITNKWSKTKSFIRNNALTKLVIKSSTYLFVVLIGQAEEGVSVLCYKRTEAYFEEAKQWRRESVQSTLVPELNRSRRHQVPINYCDLLLNLPHGREENALCNILVFIS